METFNFSPIGTISSCYKEKFGIPRQPNLVPAATAQLILGKEFTEESVRGLEDFSHIWIQFIFHQTQAQGWKPMVRPPRLGGNAKVGVFASRTTFRPNPLGLSVVALQDIELSAGQVILHLGGCDLMDGTPVLDIKPYLPYVDNIPDTKGGFATEKPEALCEITFTDKASKQCKVINQSINKRQNGQNRGRCTFDGVSMACDLKTLIKQILQLDPRPSYQKNQKSDRIYAMKLYDFDLRWQYTDNNKIKVIGLN